MHFLREQNVSMSFQRSEDTSSCCQSADVASPFPNGRLCADKDLCVFLVELTSSSFGLHEGMPPASSPFGRT